jgi:hypothetical protein
MHRSHIVTVVMLSGVAALSGCGSPVGATTQGAVTIDGRPAPPGIQVYFEPQFRGGSPSTGVTDDAGRYALRFNVNTVGVMPGEYVVRLLVPQELGSDGIPRVKKELRDVRLPESVGRNSTLRRTVKPGANQIDVSITAAGEAAAP